MAQKPKEFNSEASSWVTETDQYDISDEIEWACTRLQDAVRDERIARESLESLFKKRKDDALEGVNKAQQHLEFVNEEEARLRQAVSDENASTEKAPDTFVDDKKVAPDQRQLMQKFFQSLLESRHKKAEPSEKEQNSHSETGAESSNPREKPVVGLVSGQVSSLNSYLDNSERKQRNNISFRKGTEKNMVALRQLIAKYEPTKSIHAGIIDGLEIIGKQHNANTNRPVVGDAVQRVTEVPSIADISVLKGLLEQEERMLAYYDAAIQEEEMQMATYRRFIAAETA